MPYLNLKTMAGVEEQFLVKPLAAHLPTVPAVYLITRMVPNVFHQQTHTILFVGETKDLNRAIHPGFWERFHSKHQANTVCFSKVSNANRRSEITKLIVKRLEPEAQGFVDT